MLIEKIGQSVGLLANVFGIKTESDKDAYSCNYINNELKTKIVTTTDTDLNDYLEDGKYYFSSVYIPLNIPVGVNGWLIVLKGNGAVKQIWSRHGTINSNDHMTYIRTLSNGVWSNWKKIITEDDLFYKTGDTFNISNLACVGHLTSNQGQIIFNITTDKRLDNIKNIKIVSMTGNVRHSDGGYAAQGNYLSTGNVSANKSTNNSIRIVLKLNKESTFANNGTVTADISSAVIEFSGEE